MRKFVVLSNITGRRGIHYSSGSEITESQINPGSIDSLINRGFIKEKTWDAPITGKIKLAIVTSIWGRPEVFRMFMKGIQKLVDGCHDFHFTLVLSTSFQNDRSKCFDEEIAFEDLYNGWIGDSPCPFVTIEIPNEPLAAKVNATTYACRDLGVHYVLCLGSDDIISPELLNEYAKYMRKGIDFIGVSDFYFYDTVSNKALYWGGYREQWRKGHSAGAGRALSARLLEQWNWMPWENKDSLMLDKSMQDKLKITPHTIEVFSMKEKGLFALDIKSSTNMTPFKQWDNSEFIDVEIIKKQFPYIF